MTTRVHSLVARVAAAEATVRKFKDQTYAWGSTDCVRMAAFNLKQLGYKPRLSRGGSYKSALGARRALRAAGFATIREALADLGLEQIGHARALPGDLAELPSDDPDWPALGVFLGNGRVLAFAAVMGGKCAIAQPRHENILAAWRV